MRTIAARALVLHFGAYDHGVELGATDRLVAVAQLSDNPDKP
jgi:hypothetical protein